MKRGSTGHASDDGKCLVLALPDMHHDFMSGLSERLQSAVPAAKKLTPFFSYSQAGTRQRWPSLAFFVHKQRARPLVLRERAPY